MHSDDGISHVPEKKARSKKCPICFDSIYISDTRPVRFYFGQEVEPPREGSDLVLRLVMRTAGNTLALPRDGAESLPKGEEIPWFFAAEVMDYARVMKGTEEYMLAQLDGDIQALEIQGREDELMFGEDNVEWSRKAIRMLNEAKEKVKGIGGPSLAAMAPVPPKQKRPPIEFDLTREAPEMYAILHASSSGQSLPGQRAESFPPAPASNFVVNPAMGLGARVDSVLTPEPIKPVAPAQPMHANPHIDRGSRNKSQTPSEYYFYQALLHYYLSPLDIRILREAFGPFASFPATILPRVERVSTGHVVDDELRKRTKYLAHLPYGCEVNFLECDWTDTVPAEILQKFQPDIDRRKKRNEDKEAREEKARVTAEKEEERQYAHLRRRRPDIETDVERPFSEADFQPLANAEMADSIEAMQYEGHAGSSPPWPERQGSGFASLASLSTSPSASRTVWGTPAVGSKSPQLVAVLQERDPADDGWLQDWEKDLLHEDDLTAQVEMMSLGVGSSQTGAQLGGGKKRKKKITLMSTNVRRGA